MSVAFYRHEAKLRKRTNIKKKKPNLSDHVRYTEFHVSKKYKMYREGITLNAPPDSIRDEITEAHLYHFVNDDIYIDRSNPNTPKYIGVFRVFDASRSDYFYFFPLDADYKQLYKTRTDFDLCWSLMDDEEETPYWVDIYAIRKNKKRASC